MSDYVHKKAIRLPITESLILEIGLQILKISLNQFEQWGNEKCPELCHCGDRIPYFETEVTDERSYIDLVL